MKKFSLLLLLLSVGICCGSEDVLLRIRSLQKSAIHIDVRADPPCPTHPTPVPLPKPLPQSLNATLAAVQSQITTMFNASGVAGMAAALVYDQDVIWFQGFGTKDKTKSPAVAPDIDSLFRIGSVTKLIPAIMLLQAYESGKIQSLDDEIRKYVPDFSIQNPFTTIGESITWRQVVSQLSGLPREPPCGLECPEITSEVLAILSNYSLIVPPWTRPSYSNLGFALLGRLIAERIFSDSFENYSLKNILAPLGMLSTGYTFSPAVISKMAVGYEPDGSVAPLYDIGWEGPAGQAYSSIRDLTTFAKWINGGQSNATIAKILKPSTIREFLVPLFLNPDGVTLFGAPWEIRFQNNYLVYRKGGDIDGYAALMSFVPDLKLGLTILWSATLNEFDYSDTLYATLIPGFHDALLSLQPPQPQPANPSTFVGEYLVKEANVTAIVYPYSGSYGKLLLLEIPNVISVFLVLKNPNSPNALQIYIPDGIMSCLDTEVDALNDEYVYFDVITSSNLASRFIIPGIAPETYFYRV